MKRIFAVIMVVITILAIASCGGLSSYGKENIYKMAIENCFDLSIKPNKDLIEKCFAKECLDYFESEYNMEIDDFLDFLKEGSDESIDYLENKLGDDIKITVEILQVDETNEEEYKNITYVLNEMGIKSNIEEIVEVKTKVTISGNKDLDTDTIKYHLFKLNNNWYVYEMIYGGLFGNLISGMN